MVRRSLTVVWMSRISLHLRRFANNPNKVIVYHNSAYQPHRHQTFFSTVSQPVMTFAPPSPRSQPLVLPSIYAPQQPDGRPLMSTRRNGTGAAAPWSPSMMEDDSYFAMDTFSGMTAASVPVGGFRT